MKIPPKISIDPMREGHPEPFNMPRTIPGAWDLTDLCPVEDTPQAEVNGTAYDQVSGSPHVCQFKTPYAV